LDASTSTVSLSTFFQEDAKGNLTRKAIKYREMVRELYESIEPLTGRELSDRLILRGVAYKQEGRSKTIDDIETYVKENLADMEKHEIVLKQKVPAKKAGKKNTWSLSSLGRMVYSLLLLGDAKRDPNRAKQDVSQFIHGRKIGNPLKDFPYDVMLEMTNTGHFEAVARFFASIVRVACENPALFLEAFNHAFASEMGNRWAVGESPDDKGAYACAFLKAMHRLSSKERTIILESTKRALEQDYSAEVADEAYVSAVARGGPNVHVPTWCNRCDRVVIVEKSVDQIYESRVLGDFHLIGKCATCEGVTTAFHDAPDFPWS